MSRKRFSNYYIYNNSKLEQFVLASRYVREVKFKGEFQKAGGTADYLR